MIALRIVAQSFRGFGNDLHLALDGGLGLQVHRVGIEIHTGKERLDMVYALQNVA
jgi:hypothetical protein